MTVTIKWWQNKVVTNSVIIASNFLTGDGDFIIADRRPVPLSDHHRKFMIHHAARLLQRDVVFFLFFSPFLFFFFFFERIRSDIQQLPSTDGGYRALARFVAR